MLSLFKRLFPKEENRISVSFQEIGRKEPVVFKAKPGVRAWDALNENQINLLSLCGGGGICGKCKIRVNSGTVQSLNPDLEKNHFGSSESEDLRLACQTLLNSNVCLSEFEETNSDYLVTGIVTENKCLAPHVHELAIEIGSPHELKFQSGQHLSVVIPAYSDRIAFGVRVNNPTLLTRSYSISSSYSEYLKTGKFKLNVRVAHSPEGETIGKGSSYLCQLKPGSSIQVSQPFGTLSIDQMELEKAHFVLIAGGVGIAPFMSLLEENLSKDANPGRRRIELFYGVRTLSDTCHFEKLEALSSQSPGFSFQICPTEDIEGGQKHIHTYLDERNSSPIEGSFKDAFFLVCGPPAMVQAVQTYLAQIGVPKHRIQFDSFD